MSEGTWYPPPKSAHKCSLPRTSERPPLSRWKCGECGKFYVLEEHSDQREGTWRSFRLAKAKDIADIARSGPDPDS